MEGSYTYLRCTVEGGATSHSVLAGILSVGPSDGHPYQEAPLHPYKCTGTLSSI